VDTAVLLVVFILRYLLMFSGGVLGVMATAASEIASWVKDHS
jgi:hypothetical protein